METITSNSQNDKHKMILDWEEFNAYCGILARKIKESGKYYSFIYPVYKNGYFVAMELQKHLDIPIHYTDLPDTPADYSILVVDDLIDSGKTISKFRKYDNAVLFVKNDKAEMMTNYYAAKNDKWIVFPFEKELDMEENLVRILEYIGEDPTREGLQETPRRIIKSWEKLYSGYHQDPASVMKTFEDGSCDEMVILKDVEFYSQCEHHVLPFFGTISIGYIPDKKIIGISKLARLIEIHSRKLQVQERLVKQIADDIMKYLQPLGCMVVAEAQHFCMTARGVEKQKAKMITSAIRGVFNDMPARQEFMEMIK